MEPSNLNILISACLNGDVSATQESLSSSLVNEQDPTVSSSQLGFTPLLHAVMKQNTEIVKLLLSEGADPNICNFLKETPLHKAVETGSVPLTDLLLSHGANPNSVNTLGETPLHLATIKQDPVLMELLLVRRSNPNAATYDLAMTPLHCAAEAGSLEACKLLLEHLADPMQANARGDTPLSLADDSVYKLLAEDERLVTVVQEENCSLSMCEDVESKHLPKGSLCTNESKVFLHSFISYDYSRTEEGLAGFLADLHLEEYADTLLKAGYDDLNAMQDQMETPMPITPELLREVGITKVGHAKRILMKLAQPVCTPELQQSCCGPSEVSYFESNLYDWLTELRLEHLYENFCRAGYDRVDMLREHMWSTYCIDDEVLKTEVGVDKPGHRVRILGKLHSEARKLQRPEIGLEQSFALKSCHNCPLV